MMCLIKGIRQWRKTANSEADGFEITRNGSNETKVHIVFHLYSNPAKFKVRIVQLEGVLTEIQLPDALANILGIKVCTRIEVLNALWEYIKVDHPTYTRTKAKKIDLQFNKLQSKENKSIINNDVPLREVKTEDHSQLIPNEKQIIGCDKLSIDSISLKLKTILLPPDPIVLTHHVK